MAIPLPTVRSTQMGMEFCTAFASAAAGFYFLGRDASLFYAICADPNLSETNGSSIDRAAYALVEKGTVPWDACPGYGDKNTAWTAVNRDRATLEAMAVRASRVEQLYHNQDTIDIDRILKVLDAGYPLLASASVQDLFELDSTGSTRLNVPDERKGGSHAVCIAPEYQRRVDGVYVRYINSFGPNWGDRGTGWGLLSTNWYQFWAIYGDLYNFGGEPMGVQTYSRARDGQTKLSENFKVHEFACNDGSDKILIDPLLVEALQAIRSHFDKAVDISSGYRSASYNSSVGGASNSQHLYGTAADFRITGVNPRDIARWAEANLWNLGRIGGLGLYDYAAGDKAGFVHVDTRTTNRAQWIQTKSTTPTGYKTVGSITRDYLSSRTLKQGMSGDGVAELVGDLLATGFAKSLYFDGYVKDAVKAMQKACSLKVDGEYGPKSQAAMLELLKLKSI